MGNMGQQRQRRTHLNYSLFHIAVLVRMLGALRRALARYASASPLLQMPCLSNSNFSSAAEAILGFCLLWGDPRLLSLLEDGVVEGMVDLLGPGMSMAS